MQSAPRVIYLDDDVDSLQFVRAILEPTALRLETHTCPRALIRSCRHRLPALIILDVHMPDMSGPEVLREIRAQGVEAPTIYVTSDTRRSTRARLEGTVLFKPFTPSMLLRHIRQAPSVAVR